MVTSRYVWAALCIKLFAVTDWGKKSLLFWCQFIPNLERYGINLWYQPMVPTYGTNPSGDTKLASML